MSDLVSHSNFIELVLGSEPVGVDEKVWGG